MLDESETPMGVLRLRRRLHPTVGHDVWEAILGDEHLMSTLFTASEVALATLALAAVAGDGPLDVVVGGLGLGYTAAAVLDDERVATLRVVEALPEVAAWHERDLLPVSGRLLGDDRCRFVVADFFATVGGDGPLDVDGPPVPDGGHDAVLVDIDHTPDHHLHPSHAPFYSPAGLARVADRLRPGGVFGLWSDAGAEDAVVDLLASVFAGGATAHEVRFPNPLTGGEGRNTVYVAVR